MASASADARATEGHRRRRAAVAARHLRLKRLSAMRDAIGEAGVHGITAEMEIGLARMAQRPFADAIIQVEQAGLARDFGARLGRNQTARRRRCRGRGLLTGGLANEPARADGAIIGVG